MSSPVRRGAAGFAPHLGGWAPPPLAESHRHQDSSLMSPKPHRPCKGSLPAKPDLLSHLCSTAIPASFAASSYQEAGTAAVSVDVRRALTALIWSWCRLRRSAEVVAVVGAGRADR